MLKLLPLLPLIGTLAACYSSHTPHPPTPAQLYSAEQTASQAEQAAPQTSSTWKVNDSRQARIQKEMQESFFAKIMKSKDYDEGYALFSYGGWSNDGQILILCKADNSGDIIYIAPNTTKELTAHNFTKTNLEQLRAELTQAATLNDFTPKVFDGIEYEYVHAIKQDNNNLDIKSRLYMKVPSLAKGNPNPYLQVVAAFSSFQQKFYGK